MTKSKINRVRNKTKNFTVVLNEAFTRSDLSARAKGILAYILTLPDDWNLYKNELYEHFTEGRYALDSAFLELEELGYIHKEKSRNKGGKFDGWEYTVYESPPTAQFTELGENRLSEKPKSVNQHLQKTNIPLNTNNTKDNAHFEKFWEQYPRKVGKKKAEQVFIKLNPDEELLDTILVALEKHKAQKSWQDTQYIPHATTWLNQERWNDEVTIDDGKTTATKIYGGFYGEH
jgi:predicted transcriptional regulator